MFEDKCKDKKCTGYKTKGKTDAHYGQCKAANSGALQTAKAHTVCDSRNYLVKVLSDNLPTYYMENMMFTAIGQGWNLTTVRPAYPDSGCAVKGW